MVHNPNRLLVVERADALVEVHAFAERQARRLGTVSPGLRSQMLRASVSVSLNICEACGYHTASRAVALLEVAIGSCNELERVLRLCARLGVRDDRLEQIIANVGIVRAMTYGFRKRLQNHPTPTPPPGRNAHPRPQPSRPEPHSPP